MDKNEIECIPEIIVFKYKSSIFFFFELFDYGKASLLVLMGLLFLLNVHTCLPAQCCQKKEGSYLLIMAVDT